MAEFGINATQLSGPQGMGAEVVRPVETPRVGNPLLGMLEQGVNIFAKGLDADKKEKAQAFQNSIVSAYVNEQATINDAISTGQMTPDIAATRSRALYNRYASRYSEFIKPLNEAAQSLRGNTELGQAEQIEKEQRDSLRNNIASAEKDGYVFYPNMSPEARDATLAAYKTSVKARQALDDTIKQNTEYRTQSTFDRGLADYTMKQQSFTLVNEIAASNIESTQQMAKDLQTKVLADPSFAIQAQGILGKQLSNIKIALQSAARTNPELATPYQKIFDDLQVTSQKMIDPKQQSELLKNQFEEIILKAKILAVTSDPKVAASVAANQMWSGNPAAAIGAIPAVQQALAIMSGGAPGATTVPQVIGEAIEKPVVDQLKTSLDALFSGKIEKEEIATIQASNSVSHILEQVGDFLDKQGGSPEKLAGVAKFLANPVYAQLVQKGQISEQAQGAAKKTFQLMYEPAVIKGIHQELEQNLYQAAYRKDGKRPDPKLIKDVVNVSFTGSGITFTPKKIEGLDPVEVESQKDAIRQLKTAQVALNQLIHLGSHMSGTTDYAKTWEENKHIFLPQFFKKEEKSKSLSFKKESDLDEAVKLTPEEQARSDAFEMSDGNIKELQTEISRATNENIKTILQQELDRLLAMKARQ